MEESLKIWGHQSLTRHTLARTWSKEAVRGGSGGGAAWEASRRLPPPSPGPEWGMGGGRGGRLPRQELPVGAGHPFREHTLFKGVNHSQMYLAFFIKENFT